MALINILTGSCGAVVTQIGIAAKNVQGLCPLSQNVREVSSVSPMTCLVRQQKNTAWNTYNQCD